ncbi:Ig-like domain-containing protein [Citrobacter youngae]|uniref:Bacterial group 1 Ig-like protein n=1 Tax=Citrobacter youngae ATCC 29220 TaxID=500640 RepID=D4BH79_9ENTR|nr:Ig-like domain-containing protein [Citrobacter youngae]EFE06828.1 bacterial group 1 Ig-like protein [Citrobacter youngae ATCC 29220]
MSDSVLAGVSLILYTGKNYAGTQQLVAHGDFGELAISSASWDYASAAMSSMQAFIFSDVSTADASASYLGHAEDLLSTSVSDLTALYPSATQFPLNFLGLNPAIATLVRLVIDPEQAAPDAVASTALVGGSATNITTLSLPGRPGALGFVSLTEGSSVVAACPYGTYNSADGTIDWSGKMGSVVLEYTGGRIVVVSTSGFPDGWDFGAPEQQADGSWTVALNGGVPAGNEIAAISASPASIVNDGSSASVITASVVNANGLPVSGVTVNWSTTAGSLSVASSVTSANGKATTSLTDSGTAGLVTVTAAISGSSKSTQMTVTDSKAGYVLASLAADKNTLLNDGTDLVKLTATVKDGNGNLISGVPVYWSTTLGTLNHVEQDSDTVGESHAKLTDTGDTGTASIIAQLDNGSHKTLNISITEFRQLYFITDAPALDYLDDDSTYTTENAVAIYGKIGDVVELTLTGSELDNPVFVDNNLNNITIVVASVPEIASVTDHQEVVTVSTTINGEPQQPGTLTFGHFPTVDGQSLAATNGAKADGICYNNVYYNTSNLQYSSATATLSGSAVFAGTNSQSLALNLPAPSYDYYFTITNTVAEEVLITVQLENYFTINCTSRFDV